MVLTKKDAIAEFEKLIIKFVKSSNNVELNIDKFLKMPLSMLTESSDSIMNEIFNLIKVKTVHDLGKWAEDKHSLDIGNFVLKISIAEEIFEKWVILAKMSMNLKDMKRSELIDTKYVFAGLGNAGKTSLLNYFLYEQNTDQALKTQPTLGLEVKKLESPDGIITFWELGGQSRFRDQYLANPEKYLIHGQTLVYVIDLQDSMTLKESSDYFIKILEIMKRFDQKYEIILLFHKSDPLFLEKPTFLDNVEIVQRTFIPEIQKYNIPFITRYTSIYYPISELRNLLNNLLDYNLIFESLQEEEQAMSKKGIRTRFKDFFARLSADPKKKDNDSKETVINATGDPKQIARIEFENMLFITASPAYQTYIKQKNYSKITFILDKFTESWNNYRKMIQ